MRKILILVCAVAVLVQTGFSNDADLRAMLQVDGYGRKVEVKINNMKIDHIRGGSSESVQLLSENSPEKPQASERMKNLFCLRPGTNSIEITFSPLEGGEVSVLYVTIRDVVPSADGRLAVSDKPVFKRRINEEFKSDKITDEFLMGRKSKSATRKGSANMQNTETIPQVVQITAELNKLMSTNAWDFMSIEEGSDNIVQVAKPGYGGAAGFSINITYAFSEVPTKAFPKLGINMPANWTPGDFEEGTFAIINVPKQDIAKIPAFLHELFLKLYKAKPDYKLVISLDK